MAICDCRGKGCDEGAGFHCEVHCPNFACDKSTKKAPCTGEVSIEACGDCGKEYRRCIGHGGEGGARRSLHSHRGLYHPATLTEGPAGGGR